ncbi:MAG TPA: hypothetical protein VH475_23340, partial [Tepidisphaeraceae bacterium]
MPEHAHLLAFPTRESYDISAFFATIKLSVVRKAVSFVEHNAPDFLAHMADRQSSGKVTYRFWQRGGGYDRNVFEPATLLAMIEYIHNNPLRRGLVARSTDWIWSSARFY